MARVSRRKKVRFGFMEYVAIVRKPNPLKRAHSSNLADYSRVISQGQRIRR